MSQYHHYLKIDSSLRVNPASTDPSDCFIPLHETLSGRYQLMSIQLPVTYFTLNSTNNQVYWNDGSDRVCSLTHGYYSSMATVAAEVAAKMTAAGAGTVTCAVSTLTNVISITNTVPFVMTFGSNTLNSAADVLGFSSDNVAAATTKSGSRTMNLSTTTSYNFQISNTSSAFKTVNGMNYTFCVPAVTSSPTITYYEPSTNMPIIFFINSTNMLNIKIMDDQWRVMNNMKSNFFMVLRKLD